MTMRSIPLCCGPACGSAVSTPPPSIKEVSVGEHRIRVFQAGFADPKRAVPTVVFENGLGQHIERWGSLLQRAAEIAPVVAYDRPGIGSSRPSAYRPSPENVAAMLHDVLAAIGAKPPYVLVGFSLGGAYVRMYAARYEKDVAGIVTIDPIDFTQTREAALRAFMEIGCGQDSLSEYDQASDSFARETSDAAQLAEWEEAWALIQDGFASFNRDAPIPRIPQVLLASAKQQPPFRNFTFDFPAWARQSKRLSLERHLAWVSSLEDGHFVVTPSSPHMIHGNDPELVLWAIRRVLFPDPSKHLTELVLQSDEATFVSEYRVLKASYPPGSLGEDLLNTLGYEMLQQDWLPQALTVFRLNVEEYPTASNPYDSLGEAYMAQGDLALSAANYRRSLELDPSNRNAVNRLAEIDRRLQEKPSEQK
jgi:pimeloyl-ACP methyl ester carboxylesterase